MPVVYPLVSVWPGAASVLPPRFQSATFGPPPATERTLAEEAVGQLFVPPSSASSLKMYSPRPSVVHVKTKLRPAPPAGTFPLAGLGLPQVNGPPVASIAPGATPEIPNVLLTFSVTVTFAPVVTRLLLT